MIGTYEIPVQAGSYNIITESINPYFAGGSSVGPLFIPIPIPGGGAGSRNAIAVAAGAHVTGIDFHSTDSFPRFDQFEPQ
jgi:hypothetical protein